MSRSMRSEASSLHASEPVVSLITWRPQAWERRLSLRVDDRSQGAAVSKQGSLLGAPTDWRLLCSPISSIPAVRQLSAGKIAGPSDPSPGSPKGEEDGGELRQQRLRARSARGGQEKALHRKLCGASHWGDDLRAGEKVRERAGVAGEARSRRISRPGYSTGLFEQQVPVKSVFAQT